MFVVPSPAGETLALAWRGRWENQDSCSDQGPSSGGREAADLIIICLRLPGDAMATKSGIQAEADLVRPGGHKMGPPWGKEAGGWFKPGLGGPAGACRRGVLATSLLPRSPTSTSAPHLFTRVSSCPLMSSRSVGGMSGGLEETASQLGASMATVPKPGWPLSTSGSLMYVEGQSCRALSQGSAPPAPPDYL